VAPPGSGEPPELRRDLGLLDATGIGFGAIVGAGIFVVIGVAAGIAGPGLIVGLFIAGVAATANALSSGQLAAEYPQSGGAYEYGYRVLHPWAGFAAGWMFLSSKIAAAGTVSLGLGSYLAYLAPGLPARGVAVAAIVLFTALNYMGIRKSSRANLVMVVASVGSLLLFAVMGAGQWTREHLVPFAPAGAKGILESAAILFFAYTGYARIATLGEEVRDPRRTIPRAIGMTIVGAMCLYAVVALVAVGAVGAPALAATGAPIRIAAEATGHRWLVVAVTAGGVVAMLGVILSQLLGLSRMGFAMARRGDLPRQLGHVGAASGVPDRAVLLVGAIAAIVAATGSLTAIVAAAAFTILVYYGIANFAAIRMPQSAKIYPDFVPWIGLLTCALLALSLSGATIAAGVILLAAGMAARALFRRRTHVEGGT
jgi:basic amino acid/polyamine antiporter, APA family